MVADRDTFPGLSPGKRDGIWMVAVALTESASGWESATFTVSQSLTALEAAA
jgi:hypothetical protein